MLARKRPSRSRSLRPNPCGCPRWHDDDGPAENRRSVQRGGHAAPTGRDRCDASERSSNVLGHGAGQAFTAAGFANYFRDLCREAELPEHCTSHGLRKAAATYLAELGFTDHQLMAWFGWTSISQAQVYTRSANRKRMAREGAKLISGIGSGSPSDPVSQNQSQPIEKTGAGK